MIGHLYRYPHPSEPNKFIYVGQGAKRDWCHRSGREGFGNRFKKTFPGIELPQPVRETVEVRDHLELNELETIWMFQYHTWRGYEGGMNLCFPGSTDYKELGRLNAESGHMIRIGLAQGQGQKNIKSGHISALGKTGVGGRISGRIWGPILGRKNAESGQILSIATPESRLRGGRKAAESGQLARISLLPQSIKARKINGAIQMHKKWHVRRGIKKAGCNFCEVI